MRYSWLLAALVALPAQGQQNDAAKRQEDLVLSCAVANAFVAVRFESGSPSKAVLEERALAYTQLARRSFGVTDEAIAVALRALNSKVNTGVTAWSDVVAFAERCPEVAAL
jgi:hypothetical protein